MERVFRLIPPPDNGFSYFIRRIRVGKQAELTIDQWVHGPIPVTRQSRGSQAQAFEQGNAEPLFFAGQQKKIAARVVQRKQ
jgi:hypothetical protein